jgi:hypothetical protein
MSVKVQGIEVELHTFSFEDLVQTDLVLVDTEDPPLALPRFRRGIQKSST